MLEVNSKQRCKMAHTHTHTHPPSHKHPSPHTHTCTHNLPALEKYTTPLIYFSLPSFTREGGNVMTLLSQPELNPRANNRYTSLCKSPKRKKRTHARTKAQRHTIYECWFDDGLPSFTPERGNVMTLLSQPELNPRANNRYTSLCKRLAVF